MPEDDSLYLSADVSKTIDADADYIKNKAFKHRQKFSGWTAQIVLHEMDHLEGVII